MIWSKSFDIFCCFFIIPILFGISKQHPASSSPLSFSTDIESLDLTILHVNDIHSHFDEINSYTGRCHEDQARNGQCFGGAGRMVTKVKEIRNKNPSKTLLLNAGDYYQGTIYYTLFKYQVVKEFANILNYTAFGVGNHDFDDGSTGLIPFVDEINFPVLAANLDATAIPNLNISKSYTVEIDGHKIGIIGYVTADTPFISSPDPELKFLDVITSVKEEAQKLKDDGIEILIALGHAGYDIDKEMASKVPDLDLIVGGHSHTFLWRGDDYPSVEKPWGDYPTYIKAEGTDKIIPVVQAYAYGKYLGHLQLSFDSNGDLKTPVDGKGVSFAEPILLDNSTKQDEEAISISEKYRKHMENYTQVIGENQVLLKLEGYDDSNLGNVITDAFVEAWDGDADMAFINNGGIRSVLVEGEITGEDIFNILPFNNTIDRVKMTGKDIRAKLEDVIADLCPNQTCYSSFWQVSQGVRILYYIQSHNQGNRIQKFQIPCNKEHPVTSWCDLEDSKEYKVVLPNFLATSKHTGVHQFAKEHEVGMSDYDAFEKYVEKRKILDEEVDGFGRIEIIWDTTPHGNTGANIFSSLVNVIAIITCLAVNLVIH